MYDTMEVLQYVVSRGMGACRSAPRVLGGSRFNVLDSHFPEQLHVEHPSGDTGEGPTLRALNF
jgi:hypothetical protein